MKGIKGAGLMAQGKGCDKGARLMAQGAGLRGNPPALSFGATRGKPKPWIQGWADYSMQVYGVWFTKNHGTP